MSTGVARDSAFLREVAVSSSVGVLVVDASGAVVFSNGLLEERLGYGSEETTGSHLEELCANRGGNPTARIHEAVEAGADESGPVDITFRSADGERIPIAATCEETVFEGHRYVTLRFRDTEGTDPRRNAGTNGHSEASNGHSKIDGHRRQAERVAADTAIGTLTSIVRELLGAGGPESVAAVGLDAVERVLGSDVGCIRRFDEETNALERVATTDAAAALVASRPAFDLDASLAGRAFRRGEPVVDRPASTEDRSPTGEAVERASLHVPLGEQGALTVFAPADEELTPADVEVAEHLASLVTAAFARATGARADAEAVETAPENEPSGGGSFEHPVRDVVEEVVGSETQEAIGRRVCERLAATGLYDGAWFVETDADGAWQAVRAGAGDTDAPPDVLDGAVPDAESDGADTIGRAVETDEICLVRHRQTVSTAESPGESPGEGAHPETEETVETAVVVPLSHVDRTYGALVLEIGAGRAFDPELRSELAVVGDVVGLAIYAAETRKLVLSEKVKELEFEVTDPGCMSVYVSEEAGAACEIEHSTLTSDGDHLCYLRVEGAPPETARDVTASAESVTDCRVIEAADDSCLLEVTKTRSGAEAMMDVGATIRSATAQQGAGTLVVEAPASADAREVADAYAELNPDSRLVAKREIDRSVLTTGTLRESVDDRLTEKQRSVLTAAYYAGYFEWPRANTAEEVADSLGISPATLHEHLRTAERKLLELVCEG